MKSASQSKILTENFSDNLQIVQAVRRIVRLIQSVLLCFYAEITEERNAFANCNTQRFPRLQVSPSQTPPLFCINFLSFVLITVHLKIIFFKDVGSLIRAMLIRLRVS